MVYEILPDIYTIPIPLPNNPLKALNAYLIKGEKRHLLIDTGFNQPECRQALIKTLQQLKIPAEELDLFITHLHADHCGLINDFPASVTRKIWASEEDACIINQLATEPEIWDDFITSLAHHGCDASTLMELTAKHPGKAYAPSQIVNFTIAKEGDILRYGNYELHVLLTPGHTPGHLVLHIPAENTLIGGDMVLERITPHISVWPNMPDALGSYLNSLEKLDRLNVASIFPGHRQPISHPKIRIKELKEHYHARLNEIITTLGTNAMTATEVASKIVWNANQKHWDDFDALQRWFAIQEALSHLQHLVITRRAQQELYHGIYYFQLLAQP